ncbi:hypothetical protein EDD85DRAFT_959748 [Armillaria nabsnona]|nr:hypothetical protein EDD85DRAFT_959748 [Armillaria nabsnona]
MQWSTPGLWTLFLSLVVPTLAVWPFSPKRFTGNSLVGAGSRGIALGERAIAFGDFNGDQFLDVLMLDEDRQTLIVYLWDHVDFEFKESASFRHPVVVENVVPGDFTHSGKLDLLVMGHSRAGSTIGMVLYPALPGGGFDVASPISVASSKAPQPIPVDLDGDMKIDLLGITSDADKPLKAWQNVWNATQAHSPLFDIIDPEFHGTQCTLASPHSNAVVDLNGDCLADVFLVCDAGGGRRSFQIWVNEKDDGFYLAQQGSLPSGVQAISFADIDRDGTIDMIFPTCSSVSTSSGLGTNCYINIAYNKQLPLCASSTQPSVVKGVRKCRSPENLCIADADFNFDLGDSSDNDAFARFPLSSLDSGALLVLDTSLSPAVPLPIKLGDANLDGFPDLLLIIDHTPKLVFSVPCEKGVTGCDTDGSGKRGWHVEKKGAEVLDSIKDARSVSFVDMDEDGTLDIMVQRSGSEKISFVQNNFYYDAFFLKAIVLNGACNNGWCYGTNGTQYLPFGVSYSGASYKYTILDTSGRRSAAQIGQLPQTSYHALQSPYSFFGLGRTNNYIENLFVGSTMHVDEHYINIEGVIPNSKVVILPGQDGAAWKRQLFLRPGKWIPWVTVTVVVGTILLAVIVLVLHLNEKREDELERRRASHHINFDAL